MAKKFYVVWQGRQTGVFTDWDTAKRQVYKFAGAKYKSFTTRAQADAAFAAGSAAASAVGEGSGVGSAVADSAGADGAKPRGSLSASAGIKTYSAKEVDALAMPVKIFTDGGCEPNPGNAGSGVALYRDNQLAELWYGLYNPNGTNNTAELSALIQALDLARLECEQQSGAAEPAVAVFCDSKYSIQCVTQWAFGWAKKNWTRKGGEIKNLDLIQQAHQQYVALQAQVLVLHVNGHVGVEGNELADRMSILAMESQQQKFVRYTDPINTAAILALRSG